MGKQLFGLLLALFFGGCGVSSELSGKVSQRGELEATGDEMQARVRVGGKELVAEYNPSAERKNRGGTTYMFLPNTEGVLYDLGGEVITAFTAETLDKGADFIWIGSEYNQDDLWVVGIDRNARPGVDEETGREKAYGPDRPVRYLLEVRNGWVWSNKVRIGDVIELDLPEATGSAEAATGDGGFPDEGEAENSSN